MLLDLSSFFDLFLLASLMFAAGSLGFAIGNSYRTDQFTELTKKDEGRVGRVVSIHEDPLLGPQLTILFKLDELTCKAVMIDAGKIRDWPAPELDDLVAVHNGLIVPASIKELQAGLKR